MASRHLEDNPSSFIANFILYRIATIQLNFSEVSGSSILLSKDEYPSYSYLIQNFPSYKYNSIERPTVESLVAFIEEARTRDNVDHVLMNKIVHYDWFARVEKSKYYAVVEALLMYMNSDDQDFSVFYDYTKSELVLSVSQNFRAFLGQEYNSVLELPLYETIKINCSSSLDLNGLRKSQCGHLDLSSAPYSYLQEDLYVKNLKIVTLSKKSIVDDSIFMKLKSNFEIEYKYSE